MDAQTQLIVSIVGVALFAVLFVLFFHWIFRSIYNFGHKHGYESGVRRSEYETGEFIRSRRDRPDNPDERIRGELVVDELEEAHTSSTHNQVFQTLDEEKKK